MADALRILAVEDENAIAQMLGVVLGSPTAKVTNAADGCEALMRIAAAPQPFDVVITDHRMPRVSGLELVRRLRAQNFGGKILVLSAHLSEGDTRAYEELKVDRMISKPFGLEELQSALAHLTKSSRPTVEA
jgi:CheY-like chemotaxis protein